MPIESCKGPEIRARLVQEYSIEAIRRFHIIPGKPAIAGCCKLVRDEVYEFAYQNKRNKNDNGIFHCGHGAGNEFLQLIGSPLPPLFNWARAPASAGAQSRAGQPQVTLNALNAEALDALNLLFQEANLTIDPKQPSGRFFLQINRYPQTPLLEKEIKAINSIYVKHSLTTAAIVNRIATEAPNVRPFMFSLMYQQLLTAGVAAPNIGP